MKVFFFTGALRVGGSETQLINLLLNLPPSVEPALVTLKRGRLDERIADRVVAHHVIGGNGSVPGLSPVTAYFRLKKLLEREKPDILQSHLPGTNIIAAFACRKTGVPHILMEEGLGVTRPLWERMLRKKAFSSPIGFVCNSEAIRDRMIAREKVDPERITLIRNAVVISACSSREDARRKLNISPDAFVVLTAASLKPVKGIDHLVRGFSEFSGKCTDPSNLLIAGDGAYGERYRSLAEAEGIRNIEFLGVRSDVPELMSASDVYVSPSLSEGLSNSIIEAMYSRLPVIATDVGGSSVLLRSSGTGKLISPGSSEEIAGALLDVWRDRPSAEELEKAKAYAEREFSTGRVVAQFTKLYRRIANE